MGTRRALAVLEQRGRLVEPAGDRPTEHRAVDVGDQDAEQAARAQYPYHRRDRHRRVIDHFEDVVAQDDVVGLGSATSSRPAASPCTPRMV